MENMPNISVLAPETEKLNNCVLELNDGSLWEGISFGAPTSAAGELVFQTGMVGYTESLTDPSYRGQILVLAYPMIGNYGVPPEELDEFDVPRYMESMDQSIHISGLIVMDYCFEPSHWLAVQSLASWLKKFNVPAVYGVDTRALIKKIRQHGVMLGKIVQTGLGENSNDIAFQDPNARHLVAEVSCKQPKIYGDKNPRANKTILMVDCGIKANQLRCFLSRDVKVKVVPWDYDFVDTDTAYDGLFLSNGPGDPTMCQVTIANLRKLIDRESKKESPLPIFGICLGNQLLGLASGAKTFKLKFGNRGQNQPCIDTRSGRCHLTMQNHGFAIDPATLTAGWKQFFYNANDNTNEGIYHESKPFMSVQFHPEARGGPNETEYLFDFFVAQVKKELDSFKNPLSLPAPTPIPADTTNFSKRVSKVLVLGSGGLSIGQAGEFDYSGSQAIKALKEEGIRSVLINPNIATVQTTKGLADKVYFVPVTPDWVTKVIELEKPDGLFLQFGGQTALNCGIELAKQGVLTQHGITVLGTQVDVIVATEDREVFAKKLIEIDESIAPSVAARTLPDALAAADSIGYPVIVRAGFALGGLGSGFSHSREQLIPLVQQALASTEQVLIERSLKGWKEIEYEVVRDAYDNCVTVCNMENLDPLGIHTGESIVVAPSQTLSDADYHMLRRVALRVVRHLGIVGECNIQYALDPHSNQYYIIEVNARLSRSSALASKATGYPLAFIAAKLALGHPLPTLKNAVTKVTTACWEPSLDYCVVKIPRWDLKKFNRVSKKISTSMKSVGEVMAIGRRFEEALQKALRMVNPAAFGFQAGIASTTDDLDRELQEPSDERIFVLADALQRGYTMDRIHELTKIDKWFLSKLNNISEFDRRLREKVQSVDSLSRAMLVEAKQLGFSDKHLAKALNSTELIVRNLRSEHGVRPVVKQVDTVAAEFPAANNYLYMTYNGAEDDVPAGFPTSGNESDGSSASAIAVLGSGSYSIGSSVEFDWCAVSCIRTLSKLGHKTIMINFNPETVSTDYDECDKLYFEELSLERVLDIYEREHPEGVVVSMGGQIANNIAMALSRHGVPVLGTATDMIETAENRYKFSRLLDALHVDQPRWKECKNLEETSQFCENVGYPCLVRPSFVLSGAGMNVVYSAEELELFLKEATAVSQDHPVVISKFITHAKEIDFDAVALHGRVVVHAISEHIENAGVHSGDASLVLPAQDVDRITIDKIQSAAEKIAAALNVSGPFNIQFIAKDNEIKVIECNVRASRSFPFVSKTLMVNFAEIATHAILNRPIEPIHIDLSAIPHVGVKVPQFSFTRLQGADPVLGVEMASTGEVACFGTSKYDAYLKALLASGFRRPKTNILISIGAFKEKLEFLPSAKKLLENGFKLFSTPGTADFLNEHDIPAQPLQWPSEAANDEHSIVNALSSNTIDLCIMLPSQNKFRRPSTFFSRGYQTRRLAVDYSVPLITNIKCAKILVEAMCMLPADIPINQVDVHSSNKTVILPGLTEVHAHLREPGGEHKEDWDTGTASALAGGYTTVLAMPNTQPSIVDATSFALVSRLAAQKARCDYGIFVGGNLTNATVLPTLASQAVALKMYLDETFSTLKLDDMTVWIEHFKNWPLHKPICLHAEKKTCAAAIFLAHLHGRPVHVCHVSSREEILIIKEAKARGVRVTCEVCPHHLFLTQEDAPRLGSFGRSEVRPRLASREDVEALWANMDTIDVIATDHAPHTIEEKDSAKPPPGFPGMETALPLMLTAVNQGRITLEQLIEKMHTNPARIFGIPEQPNTFIEVDLDQEWTIPTAMPYSKCQWTPFAGMKVVGKLRRVVLRGQVAYMDGKVLAACGQGQNVALTTPAPIPAIATQPSVAPSSPSQARARPVADAGDHRASIVSATSGAAAAAATAHHHVAASSAVLVAPGAPELQSFKGRSILSVKQFSRADLRFLFAVTDEIRLMTKRMGSLNLLRGRVCANVFYEPSTRTSSSFWAAMVRLGGSVIPIEPGQSSIAKGETLADTVRTLASYCDVVILRHPAVGAAQQAAHALRDIPVINAGDGIGEHPTQALLDIYTIRQELGTVNGLNITLVGDLKNGRTVHSLVHLLSFYKVNLTYVAPPGLELPAELFSELEKKGVRQASAADLATVLPTTDVLYVTRIQKERFSSPEEYEKLKGSYVVTTKMLTRAKEKMIIMHPLPRVDEIHPDVDTDPRAAYFRQMSNGMYIRMALLALVLGVDLWGQQ